MRVTCFGWSRHVHRPQRPHPPLAFSVVDRMDEGTYYERVQRVAHMMDVRTAFVSEEGVERAVEVRSASR